MLFQVVISHETIPEMSSVTAEWLLNACNGFHITHSVSTFTHAELSMIFPEDADIIEKMMNSMK